MVTSAELLNAYDMRQKKIIIKLLEYKNRKPA